MRHVHRMLMAPIGVIGLILMPVFQAVSESIYHWKDDSGVSCYSNTSVPNGETEFSVMFAAWPGTSKVEGPDWVDNADEDVVGVPAGDSSGAVPDARVSVLQSRIEHRRTSIQHIENLLKKHPGDSGLRNCLFQKKQYLNEDIIRLKLLTR